MTLRFAVDRSEPSRQAEVILSEGAVLLKRPHARGRITQPR